MPDRWLPPTPPVPATESGPAHAPPAKPQRSLLRRLLGPLIVAGALLLRLAGELKALIFLLPKLKLLTTSGTMLVSVAAYALIWGWKFGVGFVALLFVHEMGHYVQMRREGIRPGWMVFIPFLGAAVGARSLGGNALAEARIGLAGPIVGTAFTALLLPIAWATDDPFWRALAFTGFFLNLFNLVPVVPLDGGRAMAALAPWMWFVGLGAVAVLAFAFPNPIVLIILLLGAMETWRRWRARRSGEEGNPAYYKVRPLHRALVAGVYLALVVLLVVGMDATHLERTLSSV
jgi:Zn-dependent protease